MTKVTLNPVIELITGKIGNMVFRRAHTGKLSLVHAPDMSRVKWSQAQKDHRQRFKRAVAYARRAMKDPEIRLVYEQMAAERKQNKRPFDMAVSDYFQGNDLVWKKLYGDRPKPESWW
jgi:hypothetical protein